MAVILSLFSGCIGVARFSVAAVTEISDECLKTQTDLESVPSPSEFSDPIANLRVTYTLRRLVFLFGDLDEFSIAAISTLIRAPD